MRVSALQALRCLVVCVVALLPRMAGAQNIPTISNAPPPESASPAEGLAPLDASASTSSFIKTTENGLECITITFEGLGNQAPVPAIQGINSPGWLSLIDADVGGTGNFANEPSPQTIMFWLGSNPSIVLDQPASKVEFYYSTAVTLSVTAYDDKNNVIAQLVRPANYSGGPGDPTGDYSNWSPLSIQVPGKKIKRLNVIGGPNYTGFDNLKVCRSVSIDSVELTQAIQQWQKLDDLKTDLQDREPPVPIIAGKPAALRVYLERVQTVTQVKVEVSGAVTGSKNISHQPGCTTEKQRLRSGGCTSGDFYFTPPEGNFDITVKVRDASNNELDSHTLQFKARTTNGLKLKAVSVCDAKDVSGNWLCAQASALTARTGVLRKIAPTASVTVETTANRVTRETSSYANPDSGWWPAAVSDVANMYGFFDSVSGVFGTTVKYYGMSRPEVAGSTGGRASDIPGKGAVSRTSAIRLGVETAPEVVAHETGHTLGLRHTNTNVPVASGSPPGCYNKAGDSSTNWPFANNRIQSPERLEVGFDVVGRRTLDPQDTYEIMSYCVPRWISPQRYKMMITELGGGALMSASAEQGQSTMAFEAAWFVSGRITGGSVQFDPVFSYDFPDNGGALANEGTHRVDVLGQDGTVLVTAPFTPYVSDAESAGSVEAGPPMFSVFVPRVAGAASLVVRSSGGQVLGTIGFDGAAPAVQLNLGLPPQLTGRLLLGWTITDSDSTHHTTRVHYSSDDGRTWSELGIVDTHEFMVDFDQLPGTSSARIKLMVSDGVNSTLSIFGPFMVAKKPGVTATILSPQEGMVIPAGDLLFLEGVGLDVDDGTLTGPSLVWSSEQAGILGSGERLGVNLAPGAHTLVLKATDRDGNESTARVRVVVAGPAPVVDLTTQALDTLPTTCVAATIAVATPSLPPSRIEYSLNGGNTWEAVPLDRLPYRFIVPGSGYFHLIARAFDAAGQSTADDELFFTSGPCRRPIDLTPPVITPVLNGTRGNGDWFKSAVSVSWQVSDPESGIASAEGCSPSQLTADTTGVTLTCTAVNGAGLSSTASVTVRIDMTPPAIGGMPVPGCSIWPPNKRMTQIAAVSAADTGSGVTPGALSINVTSNEPVAPADISVVDNIVKVSADRLGSGNGRIYTVIVQGADVAGNTTTATGTCIVPHDQRNQR
jgi:hypothetical protein